MRFTSAKQRSKGGLTRTIPLSVQVCDDDTGKPINNATVYLYAFCAWRWKPIAKLSFVPDPAGAPLPAVYEADVEVVDQELIQAFVQAPGYADKTGWAVKMQNAIAYGWTLGLAPRAKE